MYKLVVKYVLFACVAIVANLAAQYVVLHVYSGMFNLYAAIFLGTMVGLLVKYVLDKKYIFYYQTQTHQQNLKKFIVYSATGVVTTFIFWGCELLFNFLFSFSSAKFLGGFIGLAIGYTIKYHLDKKFVFTKELQLHE